MTVYTLIILWSMGSNAAQHINVPGFATLEKCREAAALVLANTRVTGFPMPASFCLEVVR